MTGPCRHCAAAPGAKCQQKRVHRKGWRPKCVIDREEAEEAAFAAIWTEVMSARAFRVEAARLDARRRQRRTDLAIEIMIWAAVAMALAGFGWLSIHR